MTADFSKTGPLSDEEKRDLLASLLSEGSVSASSNLTPEQLRRWILSQLDGSAPWHVCSAVRFSGRLDLPVLQQAIAELLSRHEILRSQVDNVNGIPVRTVPQALSLRLPVIELGTRSLEELIKQEAVADFGNAGEPLIRTFVIRCEASDHVLVITIHELLADQRSADLLISELLDVYGAISVGTELARGHTSMPFDEAAARQAEWLRGRDADMQISEWKQWLDALPPLSLATDRSRPATKTFGSTSRMVEVGAECRAGLEQLADRLGVGEPAVVMACVAFVLWRYTGQDDMGVGLSVSGRLQPRIERTIGLLRNILPLRFSVDSNVRFADWITYTAEILDKANRLGGVPLARIIAETGQKRNLSQTALVQAIASIEQEGWIEVQVPGAIARTVPVDTGVINYDLELSVTFGPRKLRLKLSGNSDLYDDTTIQGILGHLQFALESASRNAALPLSSVSLLTEERRTIQIGDWNDTRSPWPSSKCLHELIADQAAAAPSSVAVCCGPTTVSYAQLECRANGIARTLLELGVRTESKVGIVATRSAETIIGMLAILKAGGAYVPIAADAPGHRVRLIAADADLVALVLPSGAGPQGPEAHLDIPVVRVNEVDSADHVPARAVPAGPGNLAYVIYTSGSTGEPKGVATEHRHIVASTAARWKYADPGTDLLMVPLTFDAAGGGFYWALTKGGAVVIPTDEEIRDPGLLRELITRNRITHVNSMPTQYQLVLDATVPADLIGLRFVDVGGEVLRPALVGEHYSRTPDALLCNCYGPTETTIFALVHECAATDVAAMSVPIGRPIWNTQVYVLDKHLDIVPPGIPGEVYLGGAGVSRGYINRPSLTADRFIPDPYGQGSGERIYRTGDWARYLADGSVSFLGRADEQVKIRGFRVELGEVEAALAAHPAVAKAAVLANDDGSRVSLVGYVAPRGNAELGHDELRSFVSQILPEYMMPSAFVILSSLPTNTSGKLDRKLLPALVPGTSSGNVAAPSSLTERTIADLFAELLGRTEVGATTDFFAIGGDSLSAARLMIQLRRQFSVDVSLSEVFKVPTVAAIASAIDAQREGRAHADSAAVRKAEIDGLVSEALLDVAVGRSDNRLPEASWLRPSEVLVTGGTGYIGCFIVAELLERTDAMVHCLVRPMSNGEGGSRIEAVMRKYGIWRDGYRSRISIIHGDLASPGLGLSDGDTEDLAMRLDSIYHCGATVNFMHSYTSLRAPNVMGTQELLKLAFKRRIKAFHYVSTMDVWIGTAAPRPFLEVALPERPAYPPTGYAGSKWVAERMVAQAADRGLPVCVYRPWLVTGHRNSGAVHTTDYLIAGLKGFLELGVLPSSTLLVEAVPVDFTAEAIIHASLQAESFAKVYFHIGNSNAIPLNGLYDWVRSFGYKFDVIDYDDAVRLSREVDTSSPLFTLSPIMTGPSELHDSMRMPAYSAIDPASEYRNLTEALRDSGISCPRVDEQFVHSMLGYLVDAGYLPQPQGS
jgi:myxalamid-type nonribosomal peptide synthetase MxaA